MKQYTLADIQNGVLSYPKIKERIKGKSSDKNKVLKIVDECRADFSWNMISSLQKTLQMSFFKLYDGFSITTPDGFDIKELIKNNHVIFVPNHQSHADYIALSYILYSSYKIPVHVAGGINLNIFPIGKMFRKSGCFFIRRSFGSDILYKLTLEAYIYTLLKLGWPLEFFFEGGRSRTGKLLAPRYGMFQMILESHRQIPDDERKPLLFIPVSISHEKLPEEKAHAGELYGKSKQKEKATQLFKLYKLFTKKFGTIHIHLNEPIEPEQMQDSKASVQNLAFECYRSVGKGMLVTPTSVISMALLDEFSGALTFEDILFKSNNILSFCRSHKIPLTKTLHADQAESSLTRAMNILISNNKVNIIEKLGRTFFALEEESRVDLLYFKNTILHHFLVPFIINSTWIKIFSGAIKDSSSLFKFVLAQRKQLKYEFYLPTIKDWFQSSMNIISQSIGRKVENLDDCLDLSKDELYKLASDLGVFARSGSYIIEGYYLVACTLKHLSDTPFTREQLANSSKEIFEMEKVHGRIIKYPESYSIPLVNNALKYFENIKLISREKGKFEVADLGQIEDVIEKLADSLTSQLTFKLKSTKQELHV